MKTIPLNKAAKIAFVGDPHLSDSPPRSRKDDYFLGILMKLQYILENNDYVFILGDLFNNRNLVNKNLIEFIKILHKNKSWKKVFAIVGNHDIYNYNIHTIRRTTLGLLTKLKYINLVRDTILLGENILIDVIPFSRQLLLPDPVQVQTQSILLGHCYYESDLDPVFSIKKEHVEKRNYDYIILGHDHNIYEPVKVGKTWIYRVPSISRGTSHEFNLNRQPTYLQVVVDSRGQIDGLDWVEIPAPTPAEVFKDDLVKSPTTAINSHAFVANITQMLQKFESMAWLAKKSSLKQILEKQEAPQFVIEYLREVHIRNMVNF